MSKLFTDSTYKMIIGVTLIATSMVMLYVSYHYALYVVGVGVLVLMAVAENRKEPWAKRLLPVFLAIFAAVIMLNQIG